MKAAFITTSTDNCDPVVGGWSSFNETPAWTRYNEAASSPDDEHLVPFIRDASPDIAFYIGAAWLPGNPRPETLAKIRSLVPFVHICFDGGDAPWWPKMAEYRAAACFSRQVNIDGAACPTADLTTLCPMDPRPYLKHRDIPKTRRGGFAGFVANTYRGTMVNPLVQQGLLELRHRKAGYKNSDYGDFAQWLCETTFTLNTAVTGTQWRRHVKGRIIEAGLAACAILEEADAPTKNWFTPGEDYLPYGSVDEAIFLARNVSDAEWARLGQSLRAKIEDKYTAKSIYEAMIRGVVR